MGSFNGFPIPKPGGKPNSLLYKRWATGTATADGAGLFTITGLVFTPTLVLMEYDLSGDYNMRVFVPLEAGFVQRANAQTFNANTSVPGLSSGSGVAITPTADGFTFQASVGAGGAKWIAIE
jgi:hypothetical protein